MLNDIRAALRLYLLGDSAIAAIVSNRVYPVRVAQGVVLPSIVYNVISELTDHHMQGASGLVMVRMQIDCWAADRDGVSGQATAAQLALAVKERIDGFRGEWAMDSSSPQVNRLQVQGVFAFSARYAYDADVKMYGVGRDYEIHYAER